MFPRKHLPPGPDENDVAQGIRLGFWIGKDYGMILDNSGSTLWRYEVNPKRIRIFFIKLFKADFVLTGPARKEVLRIRRITSLLPTFEMIENGQVVGRITYRNLLRTRCILEFDVGPVWTFHQPLFTVFFYGNSNTGDRAWIRVGPSKRQWNLLTQPGADSVHLLSALAFLHHEYWTH